MFDVGFLEGRAPFRPIAPIKFVAVTEHGPPDGLELEQCFEDGIAQKLPFNAELKLIVF